MQHTSTRYAAGVFCLAALFTAGGRAAMAQAAEGPQPSSTPSRSAPHQTGTVKDVHLHDFLLTTPSGEYAVNVPEGSHILIVPPGSTSLSSATPGGMKDLQPGDRALVTGTVGDSGVSLTATRVVLMKSAAIADAHAAQSSAWAQGVGGIVKTVTPSGITLSSGMKTVSVETTPTTMVRRYAPGSVNFSDAQRSTVAAIQPGDQLRVRGTKSADGDTITADEIVSGNFKNYSGTIASIDPATNTITLKDLTTKKTVTVAITPNSDLRRLPPQAAAMIATRMKGSPAGEEEGTHHVAVGEAGGQSARAGRPGAGEGGPGSYGGGRGGGAGADLSRMLSRLPTETLGGLKPGEAVMIVATASGTGAPDTSTAITLLVGVEPILAAPAGQSTTLSPWNMGGGEGEMGGGMGGPQ